MSTTQATPVATQSAKDYKSDQEVRWCPGCGDYSILANFQRTLPKLGLPREQHVVIAGIGCSSRFPYYMNTYGLHGIHGRAPAIATGTKLSNRDLCIWVITGDGDGMSIGGNHLLHALRRNVDLKILLFNNQIYGLTKGQYSPTSELGKKTGSTPFGSVDYPVDPLRFALAAGATFVARTIDVEAKHFQYVLERAARHKGSAFIEIYQNCPIYNDGAFVQLSDKRSRPAHAVYLEHQKPLIYGDASELALKLGSGFTFEQTTADDPAAFVHDETSEVTGELVARICPPDLPRPLGVFRSVEKPSYDEMFGQQLEQVTDRAQSLQTVLEASDTWTVE